jgi:chromosome segregation ATPase
MAHEAESHASEGAMLQQQATGLIIELDTERALSQRVSEQLAATQQQLSDVQAQLADLQSEFDALTYCQAQTRANLDATMRQLSSAEAEIGQWQDEAEQAHEQAQVWRERADTFEESLFAERETARVEAEIVSNQQHQQREDWAAELARAREQCEAQSELTHAWERRAVGAERRLATAQQQVADLSVSVQNMRDEMQRAYGTVTMKGLHHFCID